ncbi:hypothetical protein DYQ86_02735 [Acidobacteria bacterium AB60]|nr:hypothetical protein DYQ86_02735 [Acidobacteria bacterium AB60]
MWVTNINGTATGDCGCGSWLNHWENLSGRPVPQTCAVITCYYRPSAGAHVQKEDGSDSSWFIVPLCEDHNESNSTLDVGSTPLVPAEATEACAKIASGRSSAGHAW